MSIKFRIHMCNWGWINGQVQLNTWKWFAAIWIIRLYFISIYTEALVGPICIDALLATRKAWRAFINVYTCFTIILQLESRPAFALENEKKAIIYLYHCLFLLDISLAWFKQENYWSIDNGKSFCHPVKISNNYNY